MEEEKKRRNAMDGAFNLYGINLGVTEGNSAAVPKLGINESMLKRQREELSKCKKRAKVFQGKKKMPFPRTWKRS